MSRDEVIALLVSDTIERMLSQRQIFWLQRILENGFPGYANWSDEDLQREMGERGLDDKVSEDATDGDFYEFAADECPGEYLAGQCWVGY